MTAYIKGRQDYAAEVARSAQQAPAADLGFDFVEWCQDVTGVYVTTAEQGKAAVEGLVMESMQLVRELTSPDRTPDSAPRDEPDGGA